MRRFLLQKAITFLVMLMLISFSKNTIKELPVVVQSKDTELAVLMYHGFTTGNKTSEYVLNVSDFEKDIIWLKENGYEFVNASDLINHFEKGTAIPEKAVLLTFDDGYLNNYTYAYPIIKKHDVKILVSPIAFWSDYQTKNPDPNPVYANMTWEQINDMVSSGLVETGNHSYNLHSISNDRKGSGKSKHESSEEYRRLFFDDMKNAHLAIKNATGFSPVVYAYPFGNISEESVSILKCFGYKMSLSCAEGINLITDNPDCLFRLKRYNRTPNRSAAICFQT